MVSRQWIPIFSAQESNIKNPVGQKFTLLHTFKTKKKYIGYILNRKRVISFFLIKNHVLRKTIKKFKNFLGKDASRVEVFCDKSVKIWWFLKNHIYSERGSFGASYHAKNSILIFFQKISSSEGALSNIMQVP